MAVLMKLQHSMGIATTSGKLVVLLIMFVGFVVKADVNEDKKECTNQLVAVSTCLPYVGGTAKAPTPDCCKGLEQVLSSSKKCLCTLIKDRNDPGLGFKFNASLALNLPSLCKSPLSLTDCPALLHMDPKSKEAQIFYEFDKSLHSNSSQPPVAAKNTGMEPSANVKNHGGNTISMSEILLFCLTSLLIMCIW